MSGLRVGVFMREYQPSGGRCPACRVVMDSSGCRVVNISVINAPADSQAPVLSAEHRELRALLIAHPYVIDVECCDPGLLAEQRAWERRVGAP